MPEIIFSQEELQQIDELCSKHDPQHSLLAHMNHEHHWPAEFWHLTLSQIRRRIRSRVTVAMVMRDLRHLVEANGWDDLLKISEQTIFSMIEEAGRASDEDEHYLMGLKVEGNAASGAVIYDLINRAEAEVFGQRLNMSDDSY